MKIIGLHTPKILKALAITTPLVCSSYSTIPNSTPNCDSFTKTEQVDISHQKTLEESPCISIGNDTEVYPALVVNLSDKNIYQYNYNTDLENTFPFKLNNPKEKTLKGVKKIKNIQKHRKFLTIIMQEINTKNATVIPDSLTYILCGSNPNVQKDRTIFINNNASINITDFLEEDQYVLIK